jgi:hypothetical protein
VACTRVVPPAVTANPSPAEIVRRAAAIRAGWSEAVRRSRLRVDWRALGWHVPVADENLPAAALAEHYLGETR